MAAKTFIDNLGASIYKEYSSALSHDDIQLSFKEVVRKLPKGSLKKKLKTNFDKYSSRLEKHIAQLSGTHLLTPPPETHDESLQELSTAEHRRDAGESSRLDHTLIFNMLKQAPDLPNQDLLKNFTKDQKREIYSLFLQQGLVRRDVSFEKLKQVIDKLEKCLSKQSTKEDKSSSFPWESLMDYIIQLSAGLNTIAVIRILRIVFERVHSDIDKCLLAGKPVRSGKLAKILKRYLQVLHMRVQPKSKLQGIDDRPYSRYISSLISYYVDLTCLHSSKVAKKGKLGRELCGFVSYLLSSWPEQILEAVLNSCMLTEEEKERAKVLVPLVRKCVSLKPEAGNHEMYLKYMLVVCKAQDTLDDVDEVTLWTMTARQLPAGKRFIDWLQEQCPEALEQMPTEDKKFKKFNVTKFLLEEADDDLVEMLTDSLKGMVVKTSDENFLSTYNDTEYGNEEEAEDESGAPSASETDTLFFLDTTGNNKGAKKSKGKKSPVVLKTMSDLEGIVDETTDQQSEASEPQTYHLDDQLLDKFVDSEDKEFVKTDIVSITKLGIESVVDSIPNENKNSGKASAKKSKKKETREAVLTPSRSGKGKVKELHTRKKANIQQVFVSETDSETSFSKQNGKDDKQLKSVVCKMNPALNPILREERIVSVNSNGPGSPILISDIDKSDTDQSELTTDPFTMSLAGSESEGCPPNSIVEESDLSSMSVPSQYSLLSQMSEDKCRDVSHPVTNLPASGSTKNDVANNLQSQDVTPADIVMIESDMEETDTESSRLDSNVGSHVTNSTTLSTFSESALINSRSGLDTTGEFMDSADDTLQLTIQEKSVPKSTSEELQFDMELSRTNDRNKSPADRKTTKKGRKSSSEANQPESKPGEGIVSPKHSQRSPRKSRFSGSETANNSLEKDLSVEPSSTDGSVRNSIQTEAKDESSVFIELSDDETDNEVTKPDKSPQKTAKQSDNVPVKCTKTAAEKFIQKAVKSKTPKKSKEVAQSRTKSTEEIVNIVEEIQHKLSTSMKRSSRRSEVQDTSMFTDESTVSNDSDVPETKQYSSPRKSRRKSSISDDNEKAVVGEKITERSSPRKKSSKSSQSEMDAEEIKIISPKLHGSAKKQPDNKETTSSNENVIEIVYDESEDLNDNQNKLVNQSPKLKSPKENTDKALSPNKKIKSPKLPREQMTSDNTDLNPTVKSPGSDKEHKKQTPNKPSEKKSRKRSSELYSPIALPAKAETTTTGKKKRLSSSEEGKESATEDLASASQVHHKRSVTKLKTPVSAEKRKQLKSYSLHQSLSDIKAKNQDMVRDSDLEDFIVPSSQSKSASARKKSRSKSDSSDKNILIQDSDDGEQDTTPPSKKKILVSESEDDDEIPDLGKFLKQSEKDEDLLKQMSPQISHKHAAKKTPQKKSKDEKDEQKETHIPTRASPEKHSGKKTPQKKGKEEIDEQTETVCSSNSSLPTRTSPEKLSGKKTPKKKKIDENDELTNISSLPTRASPEKHSGKKTPQKKSKDIEEDEDEKSGTEKPSSPIKPSPKATRRTLRARQGPEPSEPANIDAEKSTAKSDAPLKRISIAGGRRRSVLPTKLAETESEMELSETETRTRRSVAGKKVAVKEPEKIAVGQKTPQSKPAMRKLSASTSKKAAPKMEELRQGRKRRLSGEMSASDRGSVAGDSTDSEITFPKVKKSAAVETKAPSRTSKRISTSTVPAEQPLGGPQSKRYSLRKK